jgi:hypothetical protein
MTVDSITKLDASHRGKVVIAGSHGGVYCGFCAAKGGVTGVVFNDAGIGKNRAGIGSLAYLEGLQIAAAMADHKSCRIGDGADMREHGVITFVNARAAALGCAPGQTALECAEKMLAAPASKVPVPEHAEARVVMRDTAGSPRVVVMDSAALVEPGDAGCIVITASHGGMLAGAMGKAIGPDVAGAVFSDAGVGKDRAGISRLPGLDLRRIAGATVSVESACIGSGRSLFDDGVLSHVNETAAGMGVRTGMTVPEFVDCVTRSYARAA